MYTGSPICTVSELAIVAMRAVGGTRSIRAVDLGILQGTDYRDAAASVRIRGYRFAAAAEIVAMFALFRLHDRTWERDFVFAAVAGLSGFVVFVGLKVSAARRQSS